MLSTIHLSRTRNTVGALTIALSSLIWGCETKEVEDTDTNDAILVSTDEDGDGYFPPEDCDDTDDDVNPGAVELCDQIDNNCNDEIDEGVADVFYLDADGDGYGDDEQTIEACEQPTGYELTGGDCDDDDEEVKPNAFEDCNGIDDDCNGAIDDDSPCPCDVETYDEDTTYMMCVAAASHTVALEYCEGFGYDLAVIEDQNEQAWFEETAATYGTFKWWSGITDVSDEGTWTDSSGEQPKYTNWCDGEPDNDNTSDCGDETEENCAVIDATADYCWSDRACDCAQYFIACRSPNP